MQQQSLQATNAWRILFLLFLANLFNFFDRTIPAIIIEPIRMEWNLSDLQLGLIGTAFTIVYAIAGIPLGRMADTGARRKIMGWGLAVWSGLTAVNGLAWNFWSFLLIRMGVGIGEASYAPQWNAGNRIDNGKSGADQAQLQVAEIPLHADRLDDDRRNGAVEEIEQVGEKKQEQNAPGIRRL